MKPYDYEKGYTDAMEAAADWTDRALADKDNTHIDDTVALRAQFDQLMTGVREERRKADRIIEIQAEVIEELHRELALAESRLDDFRRAA